MRILLAILVPPLAVMLCGKPRQVAINLLLCLALWLPGIVHALLVVNHYLEERKTYRPTLGRPNPFG